MRTRARHANKLVEKTMMIKRHDVAVLTCGGTFDKVYGAHGMTFRGFGAVPEIVKRLYVPVDLVGVLQKDSLDMDSADRVVVSDVCMRMPHTSLVVVHGTDTMVDTARVLAEGWMEKTIVLTGAFLPWCVRDSDAEFNLGFAIGVARYLPHGVYIAMHGTVFPWNRVVKDSVLQRFFLKE